MTHLMLYIVWYGSSFVLGALLGSYAVDKNWRIFTLILVVWLLQYISYGRMVVR